MVSADIESLRRFVTTLSVDDDLISPVDLPVSTSYSKSGVTSYSKSGVSGYSKSGVGNGSPRLEPQTRTWPLSDAEADRILLERLARRIRR